MKVNSETLVVLEKGGLGWVIPYIKESGTREFKVQLIDLDILSLFSSPLGCILLFDENGARLGQVGGYQPQEKPVMRWKPSFRHPFRMQKSTTESVFEFVSESVEAALKRLGPEIVASVRFIVEIPPAYDGKAVIHKLRKSDRSLSARLQEKSDEVVAQLKQLLAS